jgi:hypothetical protein
MTFIVLLSGEFIGLNAVVHIDEPNFGAPAFTATNNAS